MLIRDSNDLFNNMGWERRHIDVGQQTTLFPPLDGDEKRVYDILARQPGIGMDEIRDLCGLPMPKIATALLGLELKNICQCLPGKIYKLL